MTHPFFGRLTYIRVYSGHLDSGAQIVNSTKSKKERIGKIFQMYANKENPVALGHRRSHLRGHRPQGHDHGRHALRFAAPGRARVDDVPRAGHRGRDRAQDQGRPGEAGSRDPEARGGGPDVPRRAELRHRSDRHQGHGRAAPRHPGRPHEARVQGRGERRQAPGRVPRDDQEGRREVTTTRTRSRPVVRASSRRSSSRSSRSRSRPTRRTSSRTRSPVAASRASTSLRSTRASRTP